MPKKVLIPQDVAAEGKAFLTAKGYEIKMGKGPEPEQIAADARDCDAILMRTAKCPAIVMESAPHLKIVARHGVGYDNIDTAAAAEQGIYVTNTPQALSDSVAEFTLAAMLLVGKNILPCSNAQRQDNYFYKNTHKGVDLMGKTLAIIGLGRIGRAVAKKAQALEMTVVAYDPYVARENAPDGVTMLGWEEAWKQGDFVTLHLPSTPETRGSVNAATLALMKKNAFLISVARGDIVNDADLCEALNNDVLRGAVADVTCEEPTTPGNPMFAAKNLIMTPHMASNTEECMARMALHAAWEIDRVLSGEAPRWPVNKPVK